MKSARSLALMVLLFCSTEAARAEPTMQSPSRPVALADYLRRVLAANPDLQAARAIVDIAKAQIRVAKVFPDPDLTLGVVQFDATRRGNPTIAGSQLNVPIELGGKRSARVAVAESGLHAAHSDYADAVRSLRALAANAFVDALHTRLVVAQKQSALGHLQRLVEVNRRRLAAGDIAEAELLQSRVEAQQFRADVLDAQGEETAAEIAMAQLLGAGAELPIEAAGDLKAPSPILDRAGLLAAIDKRSDVRAASKRVEVAERQIDLERAKRVVDVSVGAGWQHIFPIGGPSGIPAADLVSAQVSVPLPFSHVYRGEIEAAESAHRQAQGQLQGVRVRAQAELQEALARFDAAARRVAVYDEGALNDATSVLEKISYSYERGDATLVELLIAQRTASDLHLAYWDALADRAHALVAVAQAAGLSEDLLHL